MNDEEDILEELHFKRVIRAFSTFSNRMKRKMMKQFDDWNRLSHDDQILIPEYPNKLNNILITFQKNQEFFDHVIASSGFTAKDLNADLNDLRITPTDRDYENLRSTLRQLVREWSVEGSIERSACFDPILEVMQSRFTEEARNSKKVLVPGAGLGRLAWEINRLGFHVQGNDFSLYMLLTSQFILNFCPKAFKHPIYPFSYPLSNHLTSDQSLRQILIPDVGIEPSVDGKDKILGDFSMTAGDFIEIYSRQEEFEAWDCVVTCFFLDTAQNLINYLRVIYSVLRPGGLWINHGPLQYHFEGAPEMSIELTWEEVHQVAERVGFEFSLIKTDGPPQTYSNNRLGLSSTTYTPIFSVAHKKIK